MTAPSPKRRWGKTALKAVLFLGTLVLTLAVLAAATLSFLGRRDWARVKAELIARGEPLSLAEMIPPPLPDAQNFFADPMWEELADLVEVERDGIRSWEPRLPKGQRQLDALNRTLTTDERQSLKAAFPEFVVNPDSTIGSLVSDAFEAGKTAGPPARRRAAEFILATMNFAEPLLTRLNELAERPGARFPVKLPGGRSSSVARIPNFTSLTRFLQLRIWAELVLDKNTEAWRNTLTCLRFPDTLADDPLLVSLIVRIAVQSLALDALNQGLAAGVWTDQELAEIERRLGRINLPAGMANAFRGERGFANHHFEELYRMPSGEKPREQKARSGLFSSVSMDIFVTGDQAIHNRMFQNWIDVLDAAPEQGLNARTMAVFERDRKFLKDNWWNLLRYPIAAMAIPNIPGIVGAGAQLQDKIAQARTVCGLERYHLKHGTYPEELSALVPDFLPAVPTEISTLQPLRYRREGSGFLLWSPGWNERDEAGAGDDGKWGME